MIFSFGAMPSWDQKLTWEVSARKTHVNGKNVYHNFGSKAKEGKRVSVKG